MPCSPLKWWYQFLLLVVGSCCFQLLSLYFSLFLFFFFFKKITLIFSGKSPLFTFSVFAVTVCSTLYMQKACNPSLIHLCFTLLTSIFDSGVVISSKTVQSKLILALSKSWTWRWASYISLLICATKLSVFP